MNNVPLKIIAVTAVAGLILALVDRLGRRQEPPPGPAALLGQECYVPGATACDARRNGNLLLCTGGYWELRETGDPECY